MDKINGNGLDIIQININKIKSLFPECIVDGKIDFERLKIILGDGVLNNEEKYSFTWAGKNNSLFNSLTPTKSTLIPLKEKSLNWSETNNYYIEGDNLEVLKTLNKTFFGKIKFIYIDPPYNTGNDFVYEDDFKDSIDNYLDITNQNAKANPETSGRFHTDWLNMMYPRLRQAFNLLSQDGVICISIDDREIERLKLICNEIFGENNFVACVVWERAYAPVNMKKHFSESHDFILIYAKNIENLICNGLKRTDEANSRYSNIDNDQRGPWKSGDLTVGIPNPRNIYSITTPSGRIVNPPSGSSWRVSQDKYLELLNDNRIWFGKDGNNVPSLKRFISEIKDGMTPMTIWKYTDVGHSQDASKYLMALFDNKSYFDYPKPVKLIKQLISLYDSEECFVLDFFSGSGTTAEAVMELNAEDGKLRKYILVQLPELIDEKSDAFKDGYKTICDIGEERIRRAAKKIADEYKSKQGEGLFASEDSKLDIDLGFKVFKLESSNIKAWDPSIKLDENTIFSEQETIKEDRSNLDVAYEIMLKYGVFNMPLEEVTINNKQMFNVGKGFLIIDLNNEITLQDVEAIGKEKPHCVVFKESGFGTNDNVKLNAVKTLETFGVQDIKCL